MAKSQLTLEETRVMFLSVAEGMEASKDLLTQADKAIGDGDHGVGMARGFEAVRQKLESQAFAGLDELFKAVGSTLMASIGGASGAIFGTYFKGGAKGLGGLQVFDSRALALFLVDGLEAVQTRGKAKPGDKTMVDAAQPAALRARELETMPLDQALTAVMQAAQQGMEKTKELVATTGKAKTLGERSLGHADPGAISTYLIFKSMSEYVTRETTP